MGARSHPWRDALAGCGRALLFLAAATLLHTLLGWTLYGLLGPFRSLEPFAALLAATWICLALEGRPLRSAGLALGRTWAFQGAVGFAAGAAVIFAAALAAYCAGGFRLLRDPASGPWTLLAGAAFYLLPAAGEELLFRGYAFQRLEEGIGPRAALTATSLLFAAAHLGNPGMAGPTRLRAVATIALAGILLGLAYLRTRSLALPMGLHLGWNWTQGSLLGFGVSGTHAQGYFIPITAGRPQWLTGGPFGLEGSLPGLACCLVACMVLLRLGALSTETTQKDSKHG